MKLVYHIAPKQRLIIVEHAVKQMKAFTQNRWWHREAGGVLLGRHLLDSSDIVIDEVTTPQNTDRRSRFSFFRSKRHEMLAQERWKQSNNTAAYLGLWHTHPEKYPTPSTIDTADWRQAIEHDAFDGEQLFFPIVGTCCIKVWCLNRHGQLRELAEKINYV
ncbi:MAG: Mov34/MPN/PAD-1 family protein [Methylophilaceae bacterium]|nr:Mov34/MPN/PAD-1 family protein [Methylophilaceae bacterium]